MNEQITQAITILNQGGIIIFPTDTAFGIGCRLDRPDSVRKLFSIRERPLTQPTPILVSSIAMAKKYARFSQSIEENLLNKYWPGALTVIAPVITEIDELLQKDGGIGLRVPNNETTLSLIDHVGVGVLGPSANFHGKKTPFRVEDLDPELIRKVDYVVEGECRLKRESTVISTLTQPWSIVRQGAVTLTV